MTIFIADGAVPDEREAAADLARVLGMMSGYVFHVSEEGSVAVRGLYVGRTRAAAQHGAFPIRPNDMSIRKPSGVEPDGFMVWTSGASVFLEGATSEATGFAVSWLLEHEGGVRWYVPGTMGEVVPRRASWNLPELDIANAPAFVSREIDGLEGPEGDDWARHNGLRKRFEFGHAMTATFAPDVFAEHPDWAPLIDGRRFIPTTRADNNWQPNLAMPAVAAYAALAANESLARNPARTCVSLGINDTVRFDQSTVTRSLVEPVKYFRGKPDYSSLVFSFMNRVAEEVTKAHPDATLGCLAYFWCEDVPPFQMNPAVMPYVTTDRSQYYDAGFRAGDLTLMSRWGASGVRAFGLWEYGFGEGFLIPREPIRALADSAREGWLRGARGYFAEVGPQWGFDAFKVWMLAQIIWDPSRTLNELEADFYTGYYGPAAPSMRRFFDGCELQWMSQAGQPYWLKLYQQEDQALIFPPETCRDLRRLLDVAAQAASNDPSVRARVEVTSMAFAVTEAYVAFDEERRLLSSLEASGSAGSAAGENEMSEGIKRFALLRTRLVEAYSRASAGTHPAMAKTSLSYFVRDDPVSRLLWLAGLRDSSAPNRLLEEAGVQAAEWEPWRAMARALERGGLSSAPNLVANGSFSQPTRKNQRPQYLYPRYGLIPASWELRAMPTETGKLAQMGNGVESTGHLVRIEGAWDTQLYQWVSAKPRSRYVACAQLRGKSSGGNDSAQFLTFLSVTGNVVGIRGMQSIPKGLTNDWRTVALAAEAPEDAAWVGTGIGASRQLPGDWLEVSNVQLRTDSDRTSQ